MFVVYYTSVGNYMDPDFVPCEDHFEVETEEEAMLAVEHMEGIGRIDVGYEER